MKNLKPCLILCILFFAQCSLSNWQVDNSTDALHIVSISPETDATVESVSEVKCQGYCGRTDREGGQ